MRKLLACGGVIALLAGCGEAQTRSSASSSPSAATPTIIQPEAQSGSLAEANKRLAAAGYAVQSHPGSGNVVQELRTDGVEIFSYRTPAAAHAGYVSVRAVFEKHPGKGVAALVGAHLYDYGRPRALTPAERARFSKIVSIAEGNG